MDGRRHDPLTDAALDRELDAALDVEPSPEFVARVRTRLAEIPEPSPWRGGWRLAAAGFAVPVVVAVLAGVLWERRHPDPAQQVSGEPDVALTAQVLPPVPSASQHITSGGASIAAGRPDGSPSSSAMHLSESRVVEETAGGRSPFSNALVPPTQRLAIEALVARVRESQVVTAMPAEPAADDEPPALVIEPIEIQGVAVVALLELE